MLKIVVCDDEVKESNRTVRILEKFLRDNVDAWDIHVENDGEEFLQECMEGKLVPDLVFMDIEMGRASGIHISEKLNKILSTCVIVYLSNYMEYTLDVYGTEHLYYVLKTQLEERLPQVFEKLKEILTESGEMVSVVLKYNELANLRADDICYFERHGRKTSIFLDDTCYETSQNLEELTGQLPEAFLRCHNSYIVNMKKIINYKRDSFLIQSDREIPISRRYQQEVKEIYMSWLKKHFLV